MANSVAFLNDHRTSHDMPPVGNMFAYPPIIVIGMHRSGTTMICRLLERLGLFTGYNKDSNCEARLFHNINLWLMSQAGARWDSPSAFLSLLSNDDLRALSVNYVRRYLLRSPRIASYLGLAKYLKYRSVSMLDQPWGWKDPLNTFTLPLWLEMFPGARIVHIYRHGVDVANSLKTRGRRGMAQNWAQRAYYALPPLHWAKPKHGTFIESVRCDSFEGGFGLWEEYVTQAQRHVQSVGSHALEVRYEEFLSDPIPVLAQMTAFCNLRVTPDEIQAVAQQLRVERAFAYKRDPRLARLAEQEAARLSVLEY